MKIRSLAFLALLSGSFVVGGCSGAPLEEEASDDSPDQTDQAIVDVLNSPVKRQAIGNCWLYATASWAESITMARSSQSTPNYSESYWTYWHWFDELTRGYVTTEIETGGSYEVAREIIKSYGVMNEGDFIPQEATAEMSARQSSALAAINKSIKEGALKTSAARRDKALVRAELDKAWGLDTSVVAQLDTAFGKGVTRTLRSGATTTTTKIMRPTQIQVKYTNGATNASKNTSLNVALGEWKTASYPTWDKTSRRNFQIRFQRAMNDKQPVIVSWFVDFNALNSNSEFAAPPATPGRQGGHMTVMEDYKVTLKDGRVLDVGKPASAADMKLALDPAAKLEIIRIKNSWGAYRPDRWKDAALPGFHDLYMAYLDGPVKHCEQVNGTSDPTDCYDDVPLNDVVLPPGY